MQVRFHPPYAGIPEYFDSVYESLPGLLQVPVAALWAEPLIEKKNCRFEIVQRAKRGIMEDKLEFVSGKVDKKRIIKIIVIATVTGRW